MQILLGYQSYIGRDKGATGQRLFNVYSEKNPDGSKYPFTLYGAAGLKEWKDLSTVGNSQGMQVMGSNLYAIVSNVVYKIDANKNVTNLGSITGDQGRVDLANNGTQLLIINSAGNGWIATSSTLTAISDVDFQAAGSCAFIDGFFVVHKKDTGQFYKSALLDGLSWDILEFATAEETPDNLVKVFSFNGALWLFGERSYEVYYNSGNADFPFAQIQGAVNTTRGCGARFSVVQEAESLFWFGDDRIVYQANGYNADRISTHAIESQIQTYSVVSDAFGFVYTLDGHKFYVLTFPTANRTWVYDISTGLWHERGSINLGAWRANSFSFFDGKPLVGDANNGKIYEIDMESYTEDGDLIDRIIQGSAMTDELSRVFWAAIYLDVDTGYGLGTGQGSDPQIMMRYSDDGGVTWSNERWRSVGKQGEYNKRVIWRRNGRARERIFEFRMSDPVPLRITGCYADVVMGRK